MTDVVCFIILCVGLGSEKYLPAMNFSVSLLEYLEFCKMGLCVSGTGELTIAVIWIELQTALNSYN